MQTNAARVHEKYLHSISTWSIVTRSSWIVLKTQRQRTNYANYISTSDSIFTVKQNSFSHQKYNKIELIPFEWAQRRKYDRTICPREKKTKNISQRNGIDEIERDRRESDYCICGHNHRETFTANTRTSPNQSSFPILTLAKPSHALPYRWHRSQKQQAPSNACVLFWRVKNVFDSICDKTEFAVSYGNCWFFWRGVYNMQAILLS